MSNGDDQVIDFTVADRVKIATICRDVGSLKKEWNVFKKFGYLALSTVMVTCIAAVIKMITGTA